MRKEKNLGKDEKQITKKRLVTYGVGVIVLLLVILLITFIFSFTQEIDSNHQEPHPTKCLEFDTPYATSSDGGD